MVPPARVFNGIGTGILNAIGTGILNAITPVWATETAERTSRGQFVAIEFTSTSSAWSLPIGLSSTYMAMSSTLNSI
jgi:hypothetical protein